MINVQISLNLSVQFPEQFKHRVLKCRVYILQRSMSLWLRLNISESICSCRNEPSNRGILSA